MRNQNCSSLPLLLLLVSVLSAWSASLILGEQAAQAQSAQTKQTRKTISYVFVSPNTRENLTLQEAIAGLSSPGEKRLIDAERLLACRLHLAARASKAVGSWADGAENSTFIHFETDQATVRYAASWLGKFARQKSVLYFHRRFSGGASMYVLWLSRGDRDIAAVAHDLDSNGIANRTLVPRRKCMLIYIVDLNNELKDKVLTAARRLHARLSSFSGVGGFIGDDSDREKAGAIFEQEIVKYEATHTGVHPCRKKSSTETSPRNHSSLTL